MKEIPLYGGPSLQTAKANPGTAARAANGDQGQMLGASVQKAEEAVQGLSLIHISEPTRRS